LAGALSGTVMKLLDAVDGATLPEVRNVVDDSNGNDPVTPNAPLIPVNERNIAVGRVNAPAMSKKDAPGATAGLTAAASSKGLAAPARNAGGSKVAPGGSTAAPGGSKRTPRASRCEPATHNGAPKANR